MRVLINRSDAIGDTLLTLPMAKLLKEYDPKIHITFIVSKKSINLFANLTYVDEIIEWKDYGGTINTFWSFFNTSNSSMLTTLSKIFADVSNSRPTIAQIFGFFIL